MNRHSWYFKLLLLCSVYLSVQGQVAWNELPISDNAQDRIKDNWDNAIDAVKEVDEITGQNMAENMDEIAENAGISFSESPSPSPTMTPTPSVTPSSSPSPSLTPSSSPSETPAPSTTPTATPTPTKSASPTPFRNRRSASPSPSPAVVYVKQTIPEIDVPTDGTESSLDFEPVLSEDEEDQYEPPALGDSAVIDNFEISGDFSGEIAPTGRQLFRERVLGKAVVRQTIGLIPQVIARCNGIEIVLRGTVSCTGSLQPILSPRRVELELIQVDGNRAGVNIVFKTEGPFGNACRVLFRFEITTRRRRRRGLLPSLTPISAPSRSPLSLPTSSPEPSAIASPSASVSTAAVSPSASVSTAAVSPTASSSSAITPESPSPSSSMSLSASVSATITPATSSVPESPSASASALPTPDAPSFSYDPYTPACANTDYRCLSAASVKYIGDIRVAQTSNYRFLHSLELMLQQAYTHAQNMANSGSVITDEATIWGDLDTQNPKCNIKRTGTAVMKLQLSDSTPYPDLGAFCVDKILQDSQVDIKGISATDAVMGVALDNQGNVYCTLLISSYTYFRVASCSNKNACPDCIQASPHPVHTAFSKSCDPTQWRCINEANLHYLNELRSWFGISQLSMGTEAMLLNGVSWSRYMYVNDKFEHQDLGSQFGCGDSFNGENLAWFTPLSFWGSFYNDLGEACLRSWRTSEGHYVNMLREVFNVVAMGAFVDDTTSPGPGVWCTQVFSTTANNANSADANCQTATPGGNTALPYPPPTVLSASTASHSVEETSISSFSSNGPMMKILQNFHH